MTALLASFVGGLGLFLLAMNMITEGLKVAAGRALRETLARTAGTRRRGIFAGLLLTALVQSSSAVTIATIGFVNAGLLGILQALSIVVGATVGTAMTAWLVAAMGFQFSIGSLALFMVGIGMSLRLLGANRRLGAIGEALAGFGLFFIGVDILREAFGSLATDIDLTTIAPPGLLGVALFVLLGVLMTVLTQSSSAAIAITLSAAGGGLVGFADAAAIMIGAKIGTTSTSALAVIGATANARRIAVGHVLINGFNAITGLLLLPLATALMIGWAPMQALPIISLAIYYTVFNVIGAVLLQLFLPSLAAWLEQRFVTTAESLGKPRYLDRNVAVSPELALDACIMELEDMAAGAREHAGAALSNEGPVSRDLQQQHDGLRQRVMAVETFVADLRSERMHEDVAALLPEVLRVANYVDEMVARAQQGAAEDNDLEALMDTAVAPQIAEFQQAVLALVAHSASLESESGSDELEASYRELHQHWRRLKTRLLSASVEALIPVWRLNTAIDSLRSMLWVTERAMRIGLRLQSLRERVAEPRAATEGNDEPPDEALA